MTELTVTVAVAVLSITGAFALGYWHGRAVGIERGAADAWRRRREMDRRSRT